MSNQQYKTTKVSANFGAKGWFIVILAFVSIFVNSALINDSLNVTRTAFQATGMNYSLLSFFSTAGGWVAVAGGFLWGFLSRKISARFAWVCSLLVTGVACFFWGHASTHAVYFICISAAMVGAMGFAYIADGIVIGNWFPKKKGLAMGWATAGYPLSAATATAFTSGMLAAGGTVLFYNVFGAACVLLAICCLIFVRDYPEQMGAFPDNEKQSDRTATDKALEEGLAYMRTSSWNVKKVLHCGNAWKIAVVIGAMQLTSIGIMTNFYPRMLTSGYGETEILFMLGVAGVLAIFGSILCGVPDAKVGPKSSIIITILLAILSILMNLSGIRPLIYISLPLLAIQLGGTSNYLISLLSTVWGRYDFQVIYGVLQPIASLIGCTGVFVVAVLGENFSYSMAYIVLAVLNVISLLLALTIKDEFVGKN